MHSIFCQIPRKDELFQSILTREAVVPLRATKAVPLPATGSGERALIFRFRCLMVTKPGDAGLITASFKRKIGVGFPIPNGSRLEAVDRRHVRPSRGQDLPPP